MSTRCYIAQEAEKGVPGEDKEIKCIYCHHDGYPSHTGRILLKHYNTHEKLDALLELGDISSIGSRLENDGSNDCVEAYARDYKEDYKDTAPKIFKSFEEFKHHCEEDFTYLFKLSENKWYFRNWRGPFEELTIEKCKD